MADTVMFSLRMDKETKKKCEKIYSELGVSQRCGINPQTGICAGVQGSGAYKS